MFTVFVLIIGKITDLVILLNLNVPNCEIKMLKSFVFKQNRPVIDWGVHKSDYHQK